MLRPVLPGDVSCAARALLAVPEAARNSFLETILKGAAAAALHVQREGRLHPVWGNGSLMAAARRFPLAEEPDYSDPDYCRCTVLVLEALACLSPARS
jgi:hypothetical protein